MADSRGVSGESIEAAPRYVSSNNGRKFRRHLPAGQVAPDFGRGHRQRHSFQSMDTSAVRRGVLMTGPRHHDELGELQQILPAMPGTDIGESIRADNEGRLLARSEHFLHRVYRVAFALPLFELRQHE